MIGKNKDDDSNSQPMIYLLFFGLLAQLGERHSYKVDVAGPSPVETTICTHSASLLVACADIQLIAIKYRFFVSTELKDRANRNLIGLSE